MSASIFGGMMSHLRDLAAREKRCAAAGHVQGGVCELLNSKNRQVVVAETAFGTSEYAEQPSLGQHVNRRSRTLCIALELWLSTWAYDRERNDGLLTGDCKYGDFRKLMQGKESLESCRKHKTVVNWKDYMSSQKLNMNQGYQKDLQLCMELVRIIYNKLKLTQTGTTIKLRIPAGRNICREIYQELANWGGQGIAKEVMASWFNSEGFGTGRGRNLKLSGTDIFEVITEDLMGDDAGVKDLLCKYEGELRGNEDLKIDKITSDGTQDTSWENRIEGMGEHSGQGLRFEEIVEAYIQKTPLETPKADPGEVGINPTADSGGSGVASWGWPIAGGTLGVILSGLSVCGLSRIFKSGTGPRHSGGFRVSAKRRVRYTP
ncbi:hypothetical protein C922_05742 [Plasmodium inui San Antonio 1]|uniref:Uncharacterized protein n=1 Tax=Plasmodium inui San Antonio 1 TaxID=1237626 RepID=W6ZSJ2_9APIC|nr:hypothetical protein C922_05742 [Plasmodium inui San Antonio 1]EUD63877.1 hypothetical protein C922_05742 [Plasmodium inui San Antonio 1]